MKRSTREASRQLFSLAVEQGGYFTAKQAQEAGYAYPHLDYHISCGNFLRVGHGLYRLPDLPPSEHDDLIRLTWWSRNRQDQPQAVVSHESALVLHELSDLLPMKTHLTVPPGFRKKAPDGCVLHKEALPLADVEERQGFRVTTPPRTLLDVSRGKLSQEQLDKAVAEALSRGLVRRGKLASLVGADPTLRRLAFALQEEAARAASDHAGEHMAKQFKTASAFKTSLETRLKALAEERRVPLHTLRLKVVIERLLARLFHAPAPLWLLKGGFAMELRYRPRARTTKDVDLTVGLGALPGEKKWNPERLREQLQEAAEVDLGDYLAFRIGAVQAELGAAPLGGARFSCEAVLTGKSYVKFHIDVGYGDAVVGEPETLTGEGLRGILGHRLPKGLDPTDFGRLG